jgi:hypothetical protein
MRDDELDAATGDLVVISIIGILVGQLPPESPPPKKPWQAADM